MSTIRTFSKKLLPPFSGQVQVAESNTYRALTIDGEIWEIQYVNRSHVRVATLSSKEIRTYARNPELMAQEIVDDQIVDMLSFLAGVELPFSSTDTYEYWLLDAAEEQPLALIFSCTETSQMDKFPARAEWTALPAAVMPVVKTAKEEKDQTPPVNYRLELLVSERAGSRHKAQWFNRKDRHSLEFPPYMVREDWQDPSSQELCQRYIQRQAPRLLMLHGLPASDRQRLESYCRPHAMEVARFSNLYPEIIDQQLINSLRVEARLRSSTEGTPAINNRRDGILYI